jgi:hypothetical protein
MAISQKAKIAPKVDSNAWKTFVADAMAKHPNNRSDAEREAIAVAMAMNEAEKAQKH